MAGGDLLNHENNEFTCSECKQRTAMTEASLQSARFFCPHCGAQFNVEDDTDLAVVEREPNNPGNSVDKIARGAFGFASLMSSIVGLIFFGILLVAILKSCSK